MIRIAQHNDWVVFIIVCCVFLYIFMLHSLRRDSSVLEFLLQKIQDSTNNFLSWLIISFVFCLLFSAAISQNIPIVPKLVRGFHFFGYELNKFGFTMLAVSGFYLARTSLSYIFFAGTGAAKRWEDFYFAASKIYFSFSLALMALCVVQFYFPVNREQLFTIVFTMMAMLFLAKLIYYTVRGGSLLPEKWYYKFLYICTLQIVPILVLWKVLFI